MYSPPWLNICILVVSVPLSSAEMWLGNWCVINRMWTTREDRSRGRGEERRGERGEREGRIGEEMEDKVTLVFRFVVPFAFSGV